MAKHISGRQRIARFSGLSTGRYRQLRIEEAEPNLGFPTEKTLPLKDNYYQLVTFDGGDTYDRYWQIPPVGLNSIGLTIFNECFIVGTGNSISRLNFVGNSIAATAEPFSNISTITVSPPGNNTEVLYKNNGDFATSPSFTFNPADPTLKVEANLKVGVGGTVITALTDGRVGFGTTQPERTVHINGDLRLTGTIYDYFNNNGTIEPSVLVSNALGGVQWLPNDELSFFSVGPVYGVQYKSLTGTVVSAETFYYDPVTERVGIGTSLPKQTLNLLGDAILDGNVLITGITTFSNNVQFNSNIQSNIIPSQNNTYNFGSISQRWNNIFGNSSTFSEVNVNNLNLNGLFTVSGISSVQGFLTPSVDAIYGLGTVSNRWSNINSVNGNFTGDVGFGTDATDTVTFNSSIGSNLIPNTIGTRNLGDPFFKWNVVYANTIDAVSLRANTLRTQSDGSDLVRFLTFVDSNNSPSADYENYYTNENLYYNPASNCLFIQNSITSGISTFQGNVVFGNDVNDVVTFVSKINSSILPSANLNYDLGSSTLRWSTVFGNQFSGNAGTATSLANARTFTITGDVDAPAVSFNGTSNINLVTTLDNTGVTAGTYGSATESARITVDAKGRLTSATNVGIDFANATVAQANTVRTQSTSANAVYYINFVDSNNDIASYENIYSNLSLAYNPSTVRLGIGKSLPSAMLHVGGEPRFDTMSSFNTEGSIQINRADATSRPFYIKTYNDSTPFGNYMGFDVHNGIVGSATRVLTLRGNGNVGINTVDPLDRLFVGGTARITGSTIFESDISVAGSFKDSSLDSGLLGQILSSTVTGTNWVNQSSIAAGTADQIRTTTISTNAEYFITFVDSDNPTASYENLYTDPGIRLNPSSNDLIVTGDIVSGGGSGGVSLTINDGKGDANVTFNHQNGVPEQNGNSARIEVNTDGGAPVYMDFELISNSLTGISTDLSRILRINESGLLPGSTQSFDIGSSSLKWSTIYANTFNGQFIGNADSATKLQTSRQFSIIGDVDAPAISFDGTSNVQLVATLDTTGVTSATYGSSSIVPVFSVDSKGRITNAVNTNINFAEAQVAKADSLTTSRNFSIIGDVDAPTISFNGTGNVQFVTTLDTTGVTSSTYGSSTQVPVFAVDSKGRITSAVNTSIDVSQANVATANSLSNPRTFSIIGDVDAPAVSFNGTANVQLVTTLDTTGVTSSTYGSSTQVPVFAVDAKGRITSAVNTNIDFGNATVLNSDNVATVQSSTNAEHFLTFVNSNNTTASYEALYTDPNIKWQPSTNTLILPSTTATSKTAAPIWLSGSSGALLLDDSGQKRLSWNDGGGNLVLRSGSYFASSNDRYVVANDGATKLTLTSDGATGRFDVEIAAQGANADDVITYTDGVRLQSGAFLPTTASLDLGTTTNKWDIVYANTFNGQFIGNADTATKLLTARTFSITGDVDAPSISFDGTGNVNLVTTLDDTGVTAGTYGSDAQVPQFQVDSKGRILSVTNLGINFAGATVAQADKLTTARTFTITGDVDAPAVSFDGTANVNLVTTLDNTGVGSATYGSSTTIPVFAVDAKGRITNVVNTGINFSTATVAQSEAVRVSATATDAEFYVSFVDSNNTAPGTYESVYTDGGIRYNPSSNDLIVYGDIVSGKESGGTALTANDGYGDANVTFNHQNGIPEQNGNSARIVCNTDSGTNVYLDFQVKSGVTGGAAVSLTNVVRINEGGLIPIANSTYNLGGPSNRWANVYADNITATISGNADTATKLQTARSFSITGDVDAPAVSFDGTGNVNLVTTLDDTGVTAGTYGSSTQIPTIQVDSKGRVLSVSQSGFTPSNSGSSDKLKTVSNSTNASFYLTFVNSNNASPGDYEDVFTDVGISYNPSTNDLTVGGNVTATSDVRLKKNIKTIENSLEKIVSLRGVEYDRIDIEAHHLGVIAQEVEEIIPELVSENLDGTKSVSYGNFAGLFIEAFKEQQTIIEEQNKKIDMLTSQVEILLKKLNELGS